MQIVKQPDPQTDRLYFGKALIYPVASAPFVRVFGLNGFLLFHVVLLAIVGVCGYLFLAARSSSLAATSFTTAFLGASTVAVYGVFLTPEIFNFSIVFVAYFLWVYKEVAPQPRLAGAWPEIFAAVLLGLVTYSKPSNALLIAPLIAVAGWRRQWGRGLLVGLAFGLAAALFFGATAAVAAALRGVDGCGGRSSARTDRAFGTVPDQHQVLLCRPSFRIRPIFLSRHHRGPPVAVFDRSARRVAAHDVPRSHLIGDSAPAHIPLHVERRGRTDRQPLSLERLSRHVLPAPADGNGVARSAGVGRRRVVHGKDPAEPVCGRQVHLSDH